ncbi:hypothetical protein KSP40_PGU004631 [Platanthera guangdongensis]|uniref:Uncharacterized protein n=1 Tax=Platanthera guangdongensis TaxID=2320717 RepID=A0ABR2MMA0_9ASPA
MAIYLCPFPLPCSKEHPLLRPSFLSSISGHGRLHCCWSANLAESTSLARRTANFQPSIWDYDDIQSLPNDIMGEDRLNRRDELKDDVRHLIGQKRGLIEQLDLVDSLRQLGISYHFELEIKDVLTSIIGSSMVNISKELENNLYGTALLFRLLREHGLDASLLRYTSLVNIFKSEKDRSKTKLVHDIKGMLSLYEASYLAIKGEKALDEAGDFAAKYLGEVRGSSLAPQLLEQIDHALELPLHLRMSRLHSRWFIDVYETQENKYLMLLELAKLDFNIVQSLHRKELKEMSRWWKKLGIVCDELSFARDRLVEHYLWGMAFSFEPKFWRSRIGITKILCFITTIDDIYDVYGTLDELELFTKVVDKWEFSSLQLLPDYMKICLTSLYKTMDEIANTSSTMHGLDVLPYLKRSWADLCKAFLTEARWYHSGYTPTLNEYLENAWVSISGSLILTSSYYLSDDLTLESLGRLELYYDIVRPSSLLFRLYGDLATATAEMQRGDVPTSIQCYMNEENVSESFARNYIKILIKRYWKALNKEFVSNSICLEPFKKVIVGLPRMAQCMYQHGDGHGMSGLETRDKVILMLIEPITL